MMLSDGIRKKNAEKGKIIFIRLLPKRSALYEKSFKLKKIKMFLMRFLSE